MAKNVKFIWAGLGALLLGLILTGITTGSPLIPQIDAVVIAAVVHHGPTLNHLVVAITNLGNPPVITAASVLLALYFMYRGRYRIVTFIATNMMAVNLANFLIKQAIRRPRPFIQDSAIHPLVPAGGFSFPSGHSAGAVLLFGTIFILAGYLADRQRSRRILRVVCVLMIVAIGLSRIYVQVHFPTDVMAGYACGFTGLMLSWAFLAPWLTQDGLPERLH